MTLQELDNKELIFTEDDIKNEPMVFSASKEFAVEVGGPITKAICELIPDTINNNLVIDTRVHMLKPGWYPSIAGWHCDAVPRGDDGQPVMDHPARDSMEHYFMVVDAGSGSLTEFLDDCVVVGLSDESDGNLWEDHSKIISKYLEEGVVKSKQIDSGKLYKFNSFEYHNTTPATGHGWRFFFRASYNTLTNGPHNEIRRQTQVYLPSKDSGW